MVDPERGHVRTQGPISPRGPLETGGPHVTPEVTKIISYNKNEINLVYELKTN